MRRSKVQFSLGTREWCFLMLHPVRLRPGWIRSPGGSLVQQLDCSLLPPPPSYCILHCFPQSGPDPCCCCYPPPPQLPNGKSPPCSPHHNQTECISFKKALLRLPHIIIELHFASSFIAQKQQIHPGAKTAPPDKSGRALQLPEAGQDMAASKDVPDIGEISSEWLLKDRPTQTGQQIPNPTTAVGLPRTCGLAVP